MLPLCEAAAVAEGACLGVAPDDTDQDTMFVLRHGGRLFAYLDSCPHVIGARMAWRRHRYLDATGAHIACHGHGALFDPQTGLCTSGPCVGMSLSRVPIMVDAAGMVCRVDQPVC